MSAGAAARAESIDRLRVLARRRLPRIIFDFFDGAAESEATLRGNRQAFADWWLLPRPLVDVSRIDTAIELLGGAAQWPLAIGPTGAIGFGWPKGDLALARAAAARGIPFTLSTSATVSIEEIARRSDGRHWFQAYVFRDRDFLHRLIARARDADYEALVITVDMPVGGKRERDFRNGFSLPFRFGARSVLDFATHPRWVWQLATHGMPEMANLRDFVPDAKDPLGVASSVGKNYDAAFEWGELERLRELWPRKLIVKGILRPEDAVRAAGIGCDAIVVSNHGGRQLDGAIPSLRALPAIREALAGRATILFDGGVRRGTDVLKALALGADAVLLGRATLYGVATGGDAGAGQALDIVTDELARAMRLCGATRIADIGAHLLAGAQQPLAGAGQRETSTGSSENPLAG